MHLREPEPASHPKVLASTAEPVDETVKRLTLQPLACLLLPGHCPHHPRVQVKGCTERVREASSISSWTQGAPQ